MTEVSSVEQSIATPGYFEALDVPLRRGRLFTDDDNAGRPPVLLISESLAARYFPNDDPIGQRIRPGSARSTELLFTIVGVVADVRSVALDQPRIPQMYRCAWQYSGMQMGLVVKTKDRDPSRLEQSVRHAIRAVDPNLPLFAVKPMSAVVDSSLSQRRFAMTLVGAFAVFALALASVGVYGVLAYLVTHRTREIGVRMALGAEPRTVVSLVVSEGGRLAALGLAIGLFAAAGAARAIQSQLFGITAFDPLSFFAIVLLLGAVSLLACVIPARRAMRIDPLSALRED
jgi:predicted permease